MRTNIELNEKLLAETRKILNTRTKRETVEAAMEEVVRRHRQLALLELQGAGWSGDLRLIRRDQAGR